MAKEVLLQSMSISFSGDGIMRIRIHPNAVVDLNQAKLMNENMQRIAGVERFPVIVDGRSGYTWEKDAQEYVATHSGFRIATAVIVNNHFTRVLTNSYVGFFRPEYPVRLFSNQEEAEKWVIAMMKKEKDITA